MTLAEKLKEIPVSAGVYLYKDSAGKIIYIGKAKRLRSRVQSYFQARPFDRKTDALVKQIADVEVIVTDNEVEALILEATLTKKHKPRYNVNLKDDKSYPHLKLTINEPFPKAVITRRIQKDGALYFGPFLPASHGPQDDRRNQQNFSASHLRHRNRRQGAAPVSRVSHQTLPWPMRQGTVHSGTISGSRARRASAARRKEHRTRRHA